MRFVYLIAIIGLIFGFHDFAFAKEASKHKQTKQVIKHKEKKGKKDKKDAAKTKSVKKKPILDKPRVTAPSIIYGADQLQQVLNNIINSETWDADVGVFVKSMQDGKVLFTRKIDQPLTPASTLKVLTAVAALLFLGPEYRFTTQLLTDAKSIKNGILQGNLYIVLGGDPTLTYYSLVDLLLNLKSQGINAIGGNVFVDLSAYDQTVYGPGWDERDKKSCYAAPISASIIDRNCLSFKVTSSRIAGRSAQVIKSPRYFYPKINNSVTTKSRARSCGLQLSKTDSELSLEGCMPPGSSSWGVSYVVTDLPSYNLALFKSLLNRLSINVYGKVTLGTAPETLSLISSHSSKPLSLLINDMLKKSDNIIAGALFKKIGELYTRQPGSWENGRFAVSQILMKQAGVDINGLKVLDGSGLSPDNLVKPSQLMQVLNFAYHHYTSYEFISSLPIAGVDGTLKHRMYNIARKVRAKTGTISGVVGLAGYVVGADKEPLAFVIMINGSKGMGWRYKELEDRIVTALSRYKG